VSQPGQRDDKVAAIAADAFVFGYPLVLLDLTREVYRNTPGPDGNGQRVNELVHRRAFPDASFTAVVSPNADTLYSTAFLDLGPEPLVLVAPESKGRYYLLPIMSAWTDVFAAPGTRTTGEEALVCAITGPKWRGQLPEGMPSVECPTDLGWIIGRTQTNGAGDYPAVHRFQDQLQLVPLSSWISGAPVVRPPAPLDPDFDRTPPPERLAKMPITEFFERLARLMVDNPPLEADAPAMERFARIGLVPGSFSPAAEIEGPISEATERGLALVHACVADLHDDQGGWTRHRGLGAYGTDYAKRASVALVGLGANLDADAVYPHTDVDAAGEALTGEHRYVLRFGPGQLPPAKAFWSLTMYNDRQYFVENPLDRYAIGDRDPLVHNADGSLDIWMQHDEPGAERQANWLPCPAGAFNVVLRIYWPSDEVLDDTWTVPSIERLGAGAS
jgi:hypothetical protein